MKLTSILRSRFGLFRSWLIYYAKPFNQPKMRRFYAQFVPQKGLCFDIGAHLGNRIPALRSLDATVVAVEPQPACLSYLKRKYGHDSSVHIKPVAVGAKTGSANLQISKLTPTVSTLADTSWQNELNAAARFKSTWNESIEVPVETIEDLIREFGVPDFTKIDVEGFELEVLTGLKQTLPCLSFEFFIYSPERTEKCLDRLQKLGNYQYNWSIREEHRFQEKTWLSAENLLVKLQNRKKERFSGDIYARSKTMPAKN